MQHLKAFRNTLSSCVTCISHWFHTSPRLIKVFTSAWTNIILLIMWRGNMEAQAQIVLSAANAMQENRMNIYWRSTCNNIKNLIVLFVEKIQLNQESEKAWKSPWNSEMSRLWQELQCKERFENTQERTQEEEDNPRTWGVGQCWQCLERRVCNGQHRGIKRAWWRSTGSAEITLLKC